jgi:hypothetical protein
MRREGDSEDEKGRMGTDVSTHPFSEMICA